MINLDGISYSYSHSKQALQNVTLRFDKGITGVLGINGAGKSTLLKLLSTSLKIQEGTYTFKGKNIAKHPNLVRKQLGYLPQYMGLFPEFTVTESLTYLGLLKGCSKSYLKTEMKHLFRVLNLEHVKDVKVKALSGGTKQRVGIAQAIINKPSVLIFDEPMVGLDPNERHNFNAILSELSEDSIVLISTHIIDDIQNLCEKVVILDQGELSYSGTLNGVVELIDGMIYEKYFPREQYNSMKEDLVILKTKPIKDKVLVRFISQNSIEADSVQASLEDAFLYITKYSKL